ncbi:MAG: DoxX family membrane protein [Marinilabiliaceae bacterium]|jgi:thiosulfate dehydrogenase [quinone] large subunit|nr:DoxX family membrane protein [Marinilabiliaceae bacterium]
MNIESKNGISGAGLWGLLILRILIGWHFLYEGMVKLVNPDWSSVGFLLDSQGLFSKVFISMASNPGLLRIIDLLNTWGLILVGLALILGVLNRVATWGGIALLALYFLSHPPMVGLKFSAPSEGSYLWVNKNLIEMAALYVIYLFPTSHLIGIDRLIYRRKV